MSWDPVTGASRCDLFWSAADDITANSNSFSPATSPYDDLSVNNGTTYYYRVSAVDSMGTHHLSAVTSATPMIVAAPQNLAAVAGDTVVDLNWDVVSGAVGYNVYLNNTGNVTVSNDAPSAQYQQAGLTNGTEYFYRVSAYNSTGLESVLSNEVSATPNCCNNSFSVGGMVTGHTGDVTLEMDYQIQSNGLTDVSSVTIATGTSAFTFSDLVKDSFSYDITVTQNPVGQVCTVNVGSSGTRSAAANNVKVACIDNIPNIRGTWTWVSTDGSGEQCNAQPHIASFDATRLSGP